MDVRGGRESPESVFLQPLQGRGVERFKVTVGGAYSQQARDVLAMSPKRFIDVAGTFSCQPGSQRYKHRDPPGSKTEEIFHSRSRSSALTARHVRPVTAPTFCTLPLH